MKPRVKLGFLALFGIGACNSQTVATAPVSVEATPPSVGCVRQTMNACIASVNRVIAVDKSTIRPPNFTPDIQGKVPPIAVGMFDSVPVAPLTSSGLSHYSFLLDFRPDQHIKSMNVTIPDFTFATAKTLEDYEKTGIYEVFNAVMPAECAIGRSEFYKSLDAATKGKMKHSENWDFDAGITRSHMGSSPPIRMCGRSFTVTTDFSESSDNATLENPHGIFSSEMMSFE